MKKNKLYVDVLVLGSGPSGFAAAYTASKNGAKTVIVEQSGNIGGMSTSGLMSHWNGKCDSRLYYEILKSSAEKNEFKTDDVTPVSYTHLDVYKRQHLSLRRIPDGEVEASEAALLDPYA